MKEQCPYLLLILNCKKYEFKREYQRTTWLRDLPEWLPYFHIVGDPTLTTSSELDRIKRILYVKTADDYNSLPTKTIHAFKAISEYFTFDYLFKTDDDQIMIQKTPLFFNILKGCIEKRRPHYGGYVVNIQNEYISQYYKIHKELPHNVVIEKGKYCNGRFYILSKDAVDNLTDQITKFDSEYFEDYAVGKYLSLSLKEPIFEIDTLRNFHDMDNNVIG